LFSRLNFSSIFAFLKKVLIIENDRDIREIVSYILEEEGFLTLGTAEPESIESLLPFKPDVILIDEFINSKPGHRLCHKIKQEDQLKHIPVIIISTAHDIELIATECQANDYVRKPFNIHEVVEKVVQLIDNQSLIF
jgi:two-component system phosphate regulon response regulator PhoB